MKSATESEALETPDWPMEVHIGCGVYRIESPEDYAEVVAIVADLNQPYSVVWN